MANTQGTLVESTNKSLVSRAGNSRQLSEQAAALLSEMKIDERSSPNSEVLLILMMLLEGITRNTISGDVLALSVYYAEDRCKEIGIDEDVFKETIRRFARFSEVRKQNPLAY